MIVMVPSRGRPHNIPALLEAWDETTTEPDTSMLLLVDEDDPQLPGYEELEVNALMVIMPRLKLGPKLNAAAATLAQETDVLGFMGDDVRPRTRGWDRQIMERIGSVGIAYCNDLIQGEGLPTAPFLTSNIVRELGYFSAPGIDHLYTDNAWKVLGQAGGCLTYLNDVVLEHEHPLAETGEWDDTYRSVYNDESWAHDGSAFAHWQANVLPSDGAKIRALAR